MRELIDCHVHTARCGHATGTTAQVISAAVVGGLTGIVLTEHLPLPDALNEGGSFAPDDVGFAAYAEEVREYAVRVRGTDVVLGAEADWLPQRPDAMAHQREVATAAGVEVILGSVHFLGEWPFDSPDHLDEWDRRGVDAVWVEYFETWCDAAKSGLFDVMAHPDLPKKFGHRPARDVLSLYEEAARAAAEGGVMIEVSTGGLRKPVSEIYPCPELLATFCRAGVSATVGSDAHAPEEVGYRIHDAYAAMCEAGYDVAAFPMGRGKVRWVQL